MAQRMTNDEYRIYWATRIGGRYMGTDGADEYGRRNAVEGESLARVTPQRSWRTRGSPIVSPQSTRRHTGHSCPYRGPVGTL